jgi:subtilisin family serine protease
MIVAAVGNGGTAAPLAYPAAYPGVVGVTSVDSQHHMQVDAGHGHAMFAALGVDVRAAKVDHGFGTFTGTSFAAPVVSARLALLMSRPDPKTATLAVQSLRREAAPLDFGKYGDGFGYLDPPRPEALSSAQ